MSWISDFFGTPQPTIEDAQRKASEAGESWQIETTAQGYTVHGTSYDDNDQEVPATWQFGTDTNGVENMNYLLDHVRSVQIGEEYRIAKWGNGEWDDPTGEKKQDIREYRTRTYYGEEYKAGWKKFLGL
jgi:hypothetical protein